VEDGVSETRALLAAFEAVSARLGAPCPTPRWRGAAEQARLQDQIEAVNGWDLDRTIEIAMERAARATRRRACGILSGGEHGVSRCAGSSPEARYAARDEPTKPSRRPSPSRGSNGISRSTRAGGRDHARPLLPRHVAGWILELDQGKASVEGNYSFLARCRTAAPRERGEGGVARQRTLARELEWCAGAARAAGEEQARLASYDVLLRAAGRPREAAESSIAGHRA